MDITPKKLRKRLQGLNDRRTLGAGCDCTRFITDAKMKGGVIVLVEEGEDPDPIQVKELRALLNEEQYRSAERLAVEGCDGCLNLVCDVEVRKDSVLLATVHGLGETYE